MGRVTARRLAVDLADEVGLTLLGFLRGRSVNVYTGAERVTVPGRRSEGDGSQAA
jgi:FdhD protein